MRIALALLAALACACSAPAPIHLEPGRYKRVGVVPFSDDRGLGAAYAAEVARGLWEEGFDVVGADQMGLVFGELGINGSDPLGMHDMAEIRRRTRTDALIFGSVSCPTPSGGRAQVLMLDTVVAEPLLDASARLARCGEAADAAPAARRILAAMGEASAAARREGRIWE